MNERPIETRQHSDLSEEEQILARILACKSLMETESLLLCLIDGEDIGIVSFNWDADMHRSLIEELPRITPVVEEHSP